MKLEDYIASIENYPKEGVTFRDISPLMADGNAYSYAIREIVQYATDKKIDMIVGPEARGFIVGGVVAGCAFLIELDGLNGREAIEGYDTKVLMNFPG